MNIRNWQWIMIGTILLSFSGQAATLKDEIEALRQDLYKTRAELVQAINETRVAYQEDSKESREFRDRSGSQLESYSTAMRQFQARLKAAEERIAQLEQKNAQLESLIARHVNSLQELVTEESKQRSSADKHIVAELSKALEQGLTTIQAEPTPAPQQPAADTSNLQTYTVVPGDTLSGLAKAVGISVERLKEMNNLQSDTIRVGQVLKIPVP